MELKGENRRSFFRVELNIDMCAKIKILSVKGTTINSKENYLCIKDISAGGIKFNCRLDLPKGEDVVYLVIFDIENNHYEIETNIVWKVHKKNGAFVYGGRFNMGELDRDKLITVINSFSISHKRLANPPYKHCNKRRCPYGK